MAKKKEIRKFLKNINLLNQEIDEVYFFHSLFLLLISE
jgi:hypothetical protein